MKRYAAWVAPILLLAAFSWGFSPRVWAAEGNHNVLIDSPLNGKRVTYTEFIQAMVQAKSNTAFRKITLYFDPRIDDVGMDNRFAKGGEPWHIRPQIFLYNCVFDKEFWFVPRGLVFHSIVNFFGCENMKAIFKECVFKNTFRVYSCDFEFIEFETCRFELGFKYGRTYLKDHLKFANCHFTLNPKLLGTSTGLDMEERIFVINNKLEEIDLTIDRCVFDLPDSLQQRPQYFVDLRATNFSNLRFNNNVVKAVLDLSQSSIANLFMLYDSRFQSLLVMDALNLNPVNTKVQWTAVDDNRISVLNPQTGVLVNGSQVIENEYLFNNLISCYSNLYGSFKTQGNRLGANACYVEWKNIETNYLEHLQDTPQGSDQYFNYIMNVFLREFCDYGTNPLKSMILSGYVLGVFSLIYFLFPYRIESNTRVNFYQTLLLFARYLSSPLTLAQIYQEHRKDFDQIESYEAYKAFLCEEKNRLPLMFTLLGGNLFNRSRYRDVSNRLFLRLVDRLPGCWRDLPPFRKFIFSVFYGGVLLGFLAAYLGVRLLDSASLSLNVFSTLGFGNVPVEGLPRYLTIIEGFIGWFLLSIFSVSLISQVIQ